MYYLIGEKLSSCDAKDCRGKKKPYVAVLTPQEWAEDKELFDMGIDMELSPSEVYNTKAVVNYDSLTGSFAVPQRRDMQAEDTCFSFALDEKGIVFIDESGFAEKLVHNISISKHWKMPGIERFLYDFLEQLVHEDLRLMEEYEDELDNIEKQIDDHAEDTQIERVNDIRSDIRNLRIHYEQLIDLSQELEENENDFFSEENLRYFKMFTRRCERLYDNAAYLRDYTVQLADMYRTQLEVKQNRIMSVLTVVSVIFMPLTLIVGWYGMNFRYMPELEYRYSYPIVIAVCVLIVIASLFFFKRKKLL